MLLPPGGRSGGGPCPKYNHRVPAKNITSHQKISPHKLERAKQLRKEMTPAEAKLWEALRTNKLGVHFRRQQIVAGFIVDFYCHEAGLVIEVDGGIHRSREQAQADGARDKVVGALGLRVVRFKNEDIANRLPQVLDRIRELTQR